MVVDHEEFVNDVRRGRILTCVVAKGKRTKRQRPMSPFEGGIATSCSWDGDAATTSDESAMIGSTEEEEDMAHCLILLAQGGSSGGEKILPDMSASITRSGFDIYECKTCNRVFPSFQALGGHRASHKRPKLPPPQMTTAEPAAPALVVHDLGEEDRQFHKTTLLPAPLHQPSKTLPTPGVTYIAGANKQKVHECSICGTEFGSGQALGGHMRRHRLTPAGLNHASTPNSEMSSARNSPVVDDKMSRNVLPLDLNLPATEDDRIDTKFEFGSTQQPPIVFPAGPALVGCHY